ncbi:hypothetical protein [Azospirillum melinis]
MALDIRGSLKNTKISTNKYVVIEELISNSIDSFLIRRSQSPLDFGLIVNVSISIFSSGLLGDQTDISISCSDNGCGLGDEQTDAFLTKDTSYKDDLSIAGIGKCKGTGRIQFFHSFEKVGVHSAYLSNGRVLTRTLQLVEGRKKIDAADFVVSPADNEDIGTTIVLEGIKQKVRERFYKAENLHETFFALNVRRHMMMNFLQRLVSLKEELGNFVISFETIYPNKSAERAKICTFDLPLITDQKKALVEEKDPRTATPLGRYKEFTISHYKLDATIFDLPRNAISLCAKSSPVLDITRRYLRTHSPFRKLSLTG